MSTFHGLETARRALTTQQGALYTTGNNIANANTPGYTRQRVNFSATAGYPPIGMNRAEQPGQIGTGVTAGAIQRVRESFLDNQYRAENAKLGYYGTNANALAKLEDILNETGSDNHGIAKALNDYWQAWQELSLNPENEGVRTVVLERGHAVADTFNYIHSTIEFYRQDMGKQLELDEQRINIILEDIDNLNKQIAEIELHGQLPNSLYDERDRLVDELSGYFDIEVTAVKPNKAKSNAHPLAEGTYVIKINAQEIVSVDGFEQFQISKEIADGEFKYVTDITFGNGPSIAIENLKSGKIKGLIENFGYNDTATGIYPNMLAELDKLANSFISQVNTAHDTAVFDGNSARTIEMILTDTSQIKASTWNDSGDGSRAQEVSDSLKKVMGEYEIIIGKLGVDAQRANRLQTNAFTLRSAAEDHRLSVSTVSIDEELMDMIKFQHAYNAAARNITVVDEMLDRIINGMGIVGR